MAERTRVFNGPQRYTLIHLLGVRALSGDAAQLVFETASGREILMPTPAELVPPIVSALDNPQPRTFKALVRREILTATGCPFLEVLIEQTPDGLGAFVALSTEMAPWWLQMEPADAVLMGLEWHLPFFYAYVA